MVKNTYFSGGVYVKKKEKRARANNEFPHGFFPLKVQASHPSLFGFPARNELNPHKEAYNV